MPGNYRKPKIVTDKAGGAWWDEADRPNHAAGRVPEPAPLVPEDKTLADIADKHVNGSNGITHK